MPTLRTPSEDEIPAGPVEGISAAAAAQKAFAEAAGMLSDFTGGASLLQVEWQLIQQLAQQAAQLSGDLDAWSAADLVVTLPRPWWDPPWADSHDSALTRWVRRRAVRTRTVAQVVLMGSVDTDPEGTTAEHWSFYVDAYLLGDDGVLRVAGEFRAFSRAEHPEPPYSPGDMGPCDPAWEELAISLGADPTLVELDGVGFDTTELLLKAFAELAEATRRTMASRIERLRHSGGALPAGAGGRGETRSFPHP